MPSERIEPLNDSPGEDDDDEPDITDRIPWLRRTPDGHLIEDRD